MKTYDLNVSLPDGVNMSRPHTITINKIEQYYKDVHDIYGNFCADCKLFNDAELCNKGFRPRKYNLVLGPHQYVYIRKDCNAFDLREANIEIDEGKIKGSVSNMLDCNSQQYGGV